MVEKYSHHILAKSTKKKFNRAFSGSFLSQPCSFPGVEKLFKLKHNIWGICVNTRLPVYGKPSLKYLLV